MEIVFPQASYEKLTTPSFSFPFPFLKSNDVFLDDMRLETIQMVDFDLMYVSVVYI